MTTDMLPECVAEYTKRPLLSITAAALGHEPKALERNLLQYFKMAADRDAIVLLDETDVYLEQRIEAGSLDVISFAKVHDRGS